MMMERNTHPNLFYEKFNSASTLEKQAMLDEDFKCLMKEENIMPFSSQKHPNKIRLRNCSQRLASFLEGDTCNHELGLLGFFHENGEEGYIIELYEEFYGNVMGVEIDNKKYSHNEKVGSGHTHPTGTFQHTFSNLDLGFLNKFKHKPHILLTQKNGILYAPYKGLFYLHKDKIIVEDTNPKKVLERAIPPLLEDF